MDGEANIETLPYIIFVFVNEVFNIITPIFLWLCEEGLYPTNCKSKCSLEIYLHPLPQSISLTHQGHNMKGITGRQKISSTCALQLMEQMIEYRKKFVLKLVVFQI